MKKITSSSNTSETTEACTGVVNLSKKQAIADDAYLTVIFDKLSGRTDLLIDKINDAGIQSELKEKDDLRDTDVRAIYYEVEAKCNRRQSSEQEAALRVYEELNRYGIQITDANYTLESTKIRAMLSDLKAPELVTDINSIPDLPALITNLEQSQGAFDDSNSEWLDKKRVRKSSKSASKLAIECKSIVNNELVGYIEAMSAANPDKYKDFADKMETIITDINNKVRDRIAAYKRKKETEEEAEA
ncbi:DUF6261 family protein [Marinifilum flexuosum]|uniref:DUF6261 family protein n=1 Tax=Marinifilum flexuosum TaxID=1117708 RepID=UPI002493D45D|nr:DUF6261 family protein [Marinifilum flexuosum]